MRTSTWPPHIVRKVTSAMMGPAISRFNEESILEAPPLAEARLVRIAEVVLVAFFVGAGARAAQWVRPEKAVIHALFLVWQLHRAPGDAPADYAHDRREQEVRHEHG